MRILTTLSVSAGDATAGLFVVGLDGEGAGREEQARKERVRLRIEVMTVVRWLRPSQKRL